MHQVVFSQPITWNYLGGIPPSPTILGETADGILYAVSGSRIYTSSDAGADWTQPADVVGSVEEFHANGNRLLVSRYVGGPYSHQIFTSTNDGSSWVRVFYEAVPLNQLVFGGFLLTDSGTIYGFHNATTISGMLFRLQSGSFVPVGTQVPLNGATASGIEISFIDHNNTIYAGTRAGGLYISHDMGTTWTQVLMYPVSAIAYGAKNTVVVAADATQNVFGGVFVTSDHGVTWKNLGMPESQFTSITSDSVGNILASTIQGNYYFSSIDSTWTFVGPVTHSSDNVLATPLGNLICASATDGIFRSTNQGTSWFFNGLQIQEVSSVLSLSSGSIIAGTFGERIFISSNGGVGWQQMAPGVVGDYIYSLASTRSIVYAGTEQGMYQSLDEGNHWSAVTMQVVTSPVYSMAVTGYGRVYAGTNFGVYTSTNSGQTWTQSGLSASEVTNLILDSSGVLYAATENNGIYQSSDSGSTWVSRGLVRNDIQTISVNSAGQIFAGVYGGVFYSTDNGTGWAQKLFTPYFVYSVVCNGINQVYCGTYNGVYDSYDDGKTWTKAGLQGTVILNLSFDTDNLLSAGVDGGIFQSAQPVLGVAERQSGLPISFTLDQNYPNPFNPATQIRFTVPKAGIVTLTVYDVLGQQIVTLIDGRQEPGDHSISWNALNVPSGVYFFRIVAGDFVQTKKMVLMK